MKLRSKCNFYDCEFVKPEIMDLRGLYFSGMLKRGDGVEMNSNLENRDKARFEHEIRGHP